MDYCCNYRCLLLAATNPYQGQSSCVLRNILVWLTSAPAGCMRLEGDGALYTPHAFAQSQAWMQKCVNYSVPFITVPGTRKLSYDIPINTRYVRTRQLTLL